MLRAAPWSLVFGRVVVANSKRQRAAIPFECLDDPSGGTTIADERRATSAQAPEIVMLQRRVLLVHDNDHQRTLLAEALRAHVRVATAPGLHGAMRLIVAEHFDAVLARGELPGADGLVVLKVMRILRAQTRRFLLCAIFPGDIDTALAEGLVEHCYLAPLSVQDLVRTLARPVNRGSP